MKKYFILLVIPFLFACNEKEIKKLNEEKQRLQEEANYKDSTINNLVQSFNEIEDNLAAVTKKETEIRVSARPNVEFKEDAKTRIQEEIQAINSLMERNKRIIDSLTAKIKKSNFKIGQFKKMIERLEGQLAQRDSAINSLKEELARLNFTVESLNMRIDTLRKEGQDRSAKIGQQTEALNTAYYIVGTAKDLKNKGVISKEGGFIGIGKAAKLSQTFDTDKFTRIDITKTTSIPLTGKKIKLITTHPSGSYTIEGPEKKPESITINDPEKFWKASKYLVIVAD